MQTGVKRLGVGKCTPEYVKNHWILSVLIKCVLLNCISYNAKDLKILLKLMGKEEVVRKHLVVNPRGRVV